MQEESGETACSDSNVVAAWLCPLCQQGQPDRASLSLHLTDRHSVLPTCVDKLLDIAIPKQWASEEDRDTDVQNDTDAASLQLKHIEASDSPSEVCQHDESVELPQQSGDKVKEMDEEQEGIKEQEGDGVYLQSDQEGSGKTETPDNSEKNTSNNGVVAESDDSRPFKCNACIEAFPTRTALSVHYNSVSHMQRMRTGSSKQGGESETPTPSVPVLSRPYLSNKPYQCAVCRVSYNHAITLESHMKSVLHQTRSRNAGNAANSTARSTGSGSSNMAPNVVVTSSGGGATISNCATPCSLASVTTKDGELIQTPALAPSLLTSPVASAQAVSAFLTLLTSSPNSLSHSLLPTLFATGASPGVATPRLIPQPQMLMPLILNGLQTQSQSPTLESPSQLLTQSVPLLGLSAAQQALLVQRLSSLQNQWPAVGLAATIQTNSQDTKDDVKSEVVKEETEEKGLVKGEGENLTMPVGNGKQEINEEQESKGYAQELKTESEKNRDGDCRKNGDNEMADREGCTTDGRNPVDQREAEEEGGDFDKVAQPNPTNSPKATDKSIACDYRSPSVSLHSNSSLSPINLNLTLSPDSTPQKPSPFKCALDSPDQIHPRPNLRGRHRSTGSLILTEFQSQVLWAFLESRSEADAASPPREDCEALGREVGLAEGEVRRWLGDAHNAKERQKARGAALMRSIAGYGRNVWGLENDNNNDDDDEEESALTIVEGEDNAEASGSQAMDLSSSGGRRRERDLGRESIGDPCLTSDSDNEESYTSVIVSDEDSQSGSVREGPGSPTREEVQGELTGDKGTGGGKVLRSTTVFLSDAEDEEEEGGAQRAKRKKRKRELEREEVEAKKERQDPDMDLELEAQADPPGPLPLSIDHLGHPSGILHSLPLSLSLAPFSTQFLSPYVLSLPPSVVGMGVAEGDGGKVPAFPNPPTITRFSDPLLTPPVSSHTHISRFLSNGGECESALDLSIGKNRSSTSASSTSATKDKTSVQKGRLLDGLGLRPTAGGLIVVQVKPDSASATPTSNSGGYVNCNNMAKASTVYMRAAERLNATLMERERERAKEKERQKEKEEREKAQKRPSIRGKRYRDMRRSRTIIQAEQLDVLYGCYFKDANPGKHEFEQISEWVHLPKKVVQIWFQNMRARERKGEVRFISDGTLAAVGKPLIKFTWPLSKPIFSSTPKSNTNTTNSNSLTTASTAATSARLLPKTDKEQVKEKETVKIPNPIPNRPKEVASCTVSSSSSTSASAVPKTKLETTNNVTMVKIAPKITAPVLPVTPKETLPTPPRPPQKRKHEEVSREAAYTDEEEDDRNEERFVPGIINRMVPKLSPTPITKCPAAVSQKQNGLNYWSPKGPFKINTLSREQLGLSTTPRTITPAPTPTITPAVATTTTTTTTASPASAGLVNTTTVSMAKSAPTEASFLNHSTSRRPRTHLSCLQLSILQSCYETCAHPNALECEAIGTELGLPLKVVQIWFQNTRAKEKRWRLQQEKLSPSSSEPSKKVDVSSGSYLQYNALRANRPILPKPVQLTVLEPSVPPAAGQPAGRETLRGRCEACNVGFESRAAARAHVFSPRHLATLRTTNFGQPATLANNGSGTGSGVEAIESSPPPASSTS